MEEDEDPTAELAFHFGGANAGETQAPYTVCFDDMHLNDAKFGEAGPRSTIRRSPVNQTGYLPALPKLATVKSASTTPLKWELLKKGGAVVASGESKPVGKDAASGEDVHVVDFSSVTAPGKDYTLKVGSDVSHPFDIAADASTASSSTTRSPSSITSAAGCQSRCRTRAAHEGAGRPREREGQRPGQGFSQHGRQGGVPQGRRLQLHARRDRRLVRRTESTS